MNNNNFKGKLPLGSPGLPRPTTPGRPVLPPYGRVPPQPRIPPVLPPRPGIPPVSPVLNDPPWVLLAKAAGVYETQFASAGVSDMPAEFQQTPKYETMWAFCPIVGSASMLFEGRTAFHKVAGAAFLVLDLTMVAPVLRGVAIGTTMAASAGLRMVMNRGGTLLQQQAMAQFIKTGGKLITKQVAEATIRAEMRNGHVLIVGAETSANAVNHVVAYMVEQGTGTVWRLHGGVTQLAYLPRKYVEKEALTKTVGQLNTMSIYHLAHSPAEVAAWWGKFAGSNPVSAFFRGGAPKGCAGSAVMMLEHMSKQGAIQGLPAITGAARWMPLYLDRTLGGYVMNPVNVLRGTMAHGTMAAMAPLAFRTPLLPIVSGLLPQGYNPEWSDVPPGNPFSMVSDFYSDSPGTSVASVLGIPNANFSLDIPQAAAAFPTSGLKIKLPPPYVKIEPTPVEPPPPIISLNTIQGTWTATSENGEPLRIVADNNGQPPGVWLLKRFDGNQQSRTFQVKMRGADGGYYNYPFVAYNYILRMKLINPNTLQEFQGSSGFETVRRTWRR